MKRVDVSNSTLTRVIVSGGGTGGHIFPAISIANEIQRRYPDCNILFVGANGRMEVEKVPAAGFEIITLPVKGLKRKKLWKNIPIAYRLVKSLFIVRKLLKQFRPEVVIGVGGYASAPTLMVAQWMGIPTVVQEQNSYAGVTNKLVGKKADAICVAYKGMERFFPRERIHLTGNPVRRDILNIRHGDQDAYGYFGLNPNLKTIVVVGGSLGARTINESVAEALPRMAHAKGVQIVWQTGKSYLHRAQELLTHTDHTLPVVAMDFIHHMDRAFAVADLMISRAGAGSISEFAMLGLPVILVPSPNVAEDHQTKNAQSLVDEGAAVMVRDADAVEQLMDLALELVNDEERLKALSESIQTLALPQSAEKIVDIVENIVKDKQAK